MSFHRSCYFVCVKNFVIKDEKTLQCLLTGREEQFKEAYGKSIKDAVEELLEYDNGESDEDDD